VHFRRSFAWLAPAALSLTLSGATIGTRVSWQDSGFYLAAVKELGVLYPHGFVLFLLLAKAWTMALFFVPFTLAVHLFSAACAAGAAGVLGAAARDLLQAPGTLSRASDDPPSDLGAALSGAVIGCLAASGYTFWSSAIYAKGYAFLYLVLSLLLWAMLRADRLRTPRSFMAVAALIGLAWQAHPSSTLLGPALVLFVAAHRHSLGIRGIARGAAVAAAVALGPTLLLPLLASRDTEIAFGHPTTFREWLPYVTGSRFVEVGGVFGVAETRVRSAGIYFWEEMLGGSLLVLAGLLRLARTNRRLLLWVATWTVPQIGLTVLYKLEGQHDFWLESSWLVLWLVAAVGLAALAELRPPRTRWMAAALGVAGAVWAVAANGPDVSLRKDDLPEQFGKLYFAPVENNGILVLLSDDATAVCRYLQVVEGYRPDVRILHETDFEEGESGRPTFAYERARRRDPALRELDVRAIRARYPGETATFPGVAAFLDANRDLWRERPIYLQRPLAAPELIREPFMLVPTGLLHRLVPRDHAAEVPFCSTLPLEPAEAARRFRRERGQMIQAGPGGLRVRPEAYEHRLLAALCKVRRTEADLLSRKGTPADLGRAADLYAMLRDADPASRSDRSLALSLVRCKARLGRGAEDEPLLEAVLHSDPPADVRAEAACLRGEILRAAGRGAEAEGWFRQALSVPGLDGRQRADLERRAKAP
jgi:hypothetical protein